MIPKETPNKQQGKARRSNIEKRNTIRREKRGSRGIRKEEKKIGVHRAPVFSYCNDKDDNHVTHTNDTL